MKAYKEKQYLIFQLDDGKNVKYNLATGESIGKSGKVVKDICTQLRGYDLLNIIDSFQDDKYKEFLKFIDKRVNSSCAKGYYRTYGRVNKIQNIGSFLKRINDYNEYEQFFAAGLNKIEYPLSYKFKEIPKGLFKLVREYDLKINNELIKSYIDNPNLFINLLSQDYYSIKHKAIIKLITYDLCLDYRNNTYYYAYKNDYKERFMSLVNEYNYKPKSLLKHLDNLITYEALDNLRDTINEFYDYARMMSFITNKYDKYPKNLLTTHKIACRNYNRLKIKYSEEIFNSRKDKNLEFAYDDYKIIYPQTTNDIKEEGVSLNHCVSSYIGSVIDGECHILFLRNKEDLDKSLVTLEVRNNKVVQARGKFNRDVNKKEQIVLDEYNKKLERLCVAC